MIQKFHFENLDQKIHYWSNEIKQIQKINKFFDYIDAAKNTHRIIKNEFSKNNQTYHACKGDLFFIRTDVLRKGLSNVGDLTVICKSWKTHPEIFRNLNFRGISWIHFWKIHPFLDEFSRNRAMSCPGNLPITVNDGSRLTVIF